MQMQLDSKEQDPNVQRLGQSTHTDKKAMKMASHNVTPTQTFFQQVKCDGYSEFQGI
jgi:hypothetical protein